jgi:hypothetical protein
VLGGDAGDGRKAFAWFGGTFAVAGLAAHRYCRWGKERDARARAEHAKRIATDRNAIAGHMIEAITSAETDALMGAVDEVTAKRNAERLALFRQRRAQKAAERAERERERAQQPQSGLPPSEPPK